MSVSGPGYMYAWEYEVHPERLSDFLAAYGPGGHWVKLFRGSSGYLRTELHRCRENPHRFVTLDYWESAEGWERFRRERAPEFEALDARCEDYTLSEREIGRFDVAPAGRA